VKFTNKSADMILTGGFDGIIRLFDRKSSIVLRKFVYNKSELDGILKLSSVNSISINKDNHLFVSGHKDGIINVWNI